VAKDVRVKDDGLKVFPVLKVVDRRSALTTGYQRGRLTAQVPASWLLILLSSVPGIGEDGDRHAHRVLKAVHEAGPDLREHLGQLSGGDRNTAIYLRPDLMRFMHPLADEDTVDIS
jgi:hypothetical protein